jgi:hypothetical protein
MRELAQQGYAQVPQDPGINRTTVVWTLRLWTEVGARLSQSVLSVLDLPTAVAQTVKSLTGLLQQESEALSNAMLDTSAARAECPENSTGKAAMLPQHCSVHKSNGGPRSHARPRLAVRLVHFITRNTYAAEISGMLFLVLVVRLLAMPTEVWVHVCYTVFLWAWRLCYALIVGLLLGPMVAAFAVWGLVVLPAAVMFVLVGVLLCFAAS